MTETSRVLALLRRSDRRLSAAMPASKAATMLTKHECKELLLGK